MQQVKLGLRTDVCTHIITNGTLKALYMDILWSNTSISQRQMLTCSGHTHTHTQLRHLGGVDNHKDLLNGGGRSSLYQVLLYRPSDKWDCHDGRVWGAEGPTVLWIKLKPPNEPGRRTRPGCHLVWWTPWSCRGGDEWANAFLFTELKRRGRWK